MPVMQAVGGGVGGGNFGNQRLGSDGAECLRLFVFFTAQGLGNQQMGGGTWIYLGTFGFNAGRNNECKVVLNNLSSKVGRIITADAVKIGGGMGNIARGEVSGYPRFCEAARYWLQWAGIPDSVYSESNGKNDYTDDYKCRGIVDAECPDDGIVQCSSCIGVEGKGHVDRDVQPFFRRVHGRATTRQT